MHWKVKELAEQAQGTKKYVPPVWQFYDAELQKFAELIVKECIDYCGENLSKTVGGALKIHFGVE